MITLSGQLAIRSISGRNGDFNVAKLSTSIGEFVIKDAVLDQYEEGKYQGDFVVTQIKPSYYTTRSGSLIVEIRAYLDSMTLEAMDDLSREEAAAIAPDIQDPAEEDTSKPVKPVQRMKAGKRLASTDDTPFGMTPEELAGNTAEPQDSKVNDNADQHLFGILWPLGDDVKLDATVDRLTQRDQIKRLKELGYELDFKTQTWMKIRS